MLEMLEEGPPSPGLLTDLYHPDAAYVAWRKGRNGVTTFDLYTRRAPFGGAYLLVAGLEAALAFVRAFRYSERDLRYLSQVRDYDPAFLELLGRVRFTGDILAMPEGSIAFPDEPLLRVSAPFVEALLVESGLLQAVNLATLLATKAARITTAAAGRRVAEFAFRRAQAPFTVSRSAYIGGCASTSFVAAAERYRLPATGTIPHALVQLFDSEREAFQAVAESYNRYTVLLDTYDVRRAISTVIEVAREAQERLGHTLAAVRLDSGDLEADSRLVRAALDRAGLRETRVLASGDMDEWSIAALVASGAPIDGFGVGTSLGVGGGSLAHEAEGGALGGVYKEVAYVDEDGQERPRIKLAGEKSTWPGRKEVYRLGRYEGDVIQLASEPPPPGGARLLKPVVRGGEVLAGSTPPLSEIWELAQQNLAALPEPWKALRPAQRYPVRFSDELQALRREAAEAAGGRLPAPLAPLLPPRSATAPPPSPRPASPAAAPESEVPGAPPGGG
ncbi:MAG TPA: nicotinate phosphoribosyltransferase [Chloroflexota bacterium]|jgi:nicotinate phosphoribosyltransferase|nr:nicotinate phosphoribosyltransferase [Chloroflexota bacterium]